MCESVCVCVSVAIKQTLNSNQLSSRQLCRTKRISRVQLGNTLTNRTASFISLFWKIRCGSKIAEMATMFRYPVFPHLQGESSRDLNLQEIKVKYDAVLVLYVQNMFLNMSLVRYQSVLISAGQIVTFIC